ncbi:MAG: helix-turn-helix transcriptional regulator [Clostridiaceae bacterium]
MFDIGEVIKTKRKALGISQKKLAEMAGISNTYLSDIEVGRTDPSLKTMTKIAKALDIELKELF